jgi:hypothetical protein
MTSELMDKRIIAALRSTIRTLSTAHLAFLPSSSQTGKSVQKGFNKKRQRTKFPQMDYSAKTTIFTYLQKVSSSSLVLGD